MRENTEKGNWGIGDCILEACGRSIAGCWLTAAGDFGVRLSMYSVGIIRFPYRRRLGPGTWSNKRQMDPKEADTDTDA